MTPSVTIEIENILLFYYSSIRKVFRVSFSRFEMEIFFFIIHRVLIKIWYPTDS